MKGLVSTQISGCYKRELASGLWHQQSKTKAELGMMQLLCGHNEQQRLGINCL